MLACARIGAIHSVVFSAYAPDALRMRIIDGKAKLLITSDFYYRKGEKINELTTTLKRRFNLDNPHIEIKDIIGKKIFSLKLSLLKQCT